MDHVLPPELRAQIAMTNTVMDALLGPSAPLFPATASPTALAEVMKPAAPAANDATIADKRRDALLRDLRGEIDWLARLAEDARNGETNTDDEFGRRCFADNLESCARVLERAARELS